MDNEHDWIIIGRFGRPQGLKGLVRVISFTEPQHNITNYVPWYTRLNNTWQQITVLDIERHNKFILVQIKGYQQREQLSLLTNLDIAVPRSQLPNLPAGEYYWHQLMGMKVVNKDGLILGDVTDLLETGSNDVLVVSGEKRHLIPYILGDFIVHIDDEKRVITVDWDVDF